LNYQNKNYYFLKNKHKLIKIIKTLENLIKIKKKYCIKERKKKEKKKIQAWTPSLDGPTCMGLTTRAYAPESIFIFLLLKGL
jgi:ATP phosphoribosyltransferase